MSSDGISIHKRMFNKLEYFTDLNQPYSSKEIARNLVTCIKKTDKSVKARVVEKKNKTTGISNFFIYYDKESYEQIKNGELEIPEIEKLDSLLEELKKKKSDRKNKSAKSAKSAETQTTTDKSKSQKSTRVSASERRRKSKELARINRPPDKYFDSITDVPEYLLNRVGSKAKSIMTMGVLMIDKTPKKKIEQYLSILHASQIHYDVTIQKEKEIIGFMNELAAKLNIRLQEFQEIDANEFIKKYIEEPLKKGKFSKFTSKIESKGVNEVAYLIFKNLRGKIKKYPYTESHLIKRIQKVLEESKKA